MNTTRIHTAMTPLKLDTRVENGPLFALDSKHNSTAQDKATDEPAFFFKNKHNLEKEWKEEKQY